MLIDAHVHLGRLGNRSHTAGDLKHYLDEIRAARAIVSNLDAAAGPGARDLDEMDANVACIEAARSDPRLAPLYWIRPGRADSNVYAFAGALDTESLVGAVLAPLWNDYLADDARLDRRIATLAKIDKPAFVLTGRENPCLPERAYNLARRHSRVTFILCCTTHAAWNDALEFVRQSIERGDARLSLTTSHATVDDVIAAVRAVGAERVLFGSDGLYFAREHSKHVRKTLDALAAGLPEDAYKKVIGGTAATLLGLTEG
jgi:predicted TIM-barrel fold metal-dependent hydrolase